MVTMAVSELSLLCKQEATTSPTLAGVLSPISDRSIRLTGDPLCLKAFDPKLAQVPPLADCSKILDTACLMRGSASHQSLSTLDVSRKYLTRFYTCHRISACNPIPCFIKELIISLAKKKEHCNNKYSTIPMAKARGLRAAKNFRSYGEPSLDSAGIKQPCDRRLSTC
jgi:hypothetical protein